MARVGQQDNFETEGEGEPLDLSEEHAVPVAESRRPRRGGLLLGGAIALLAAAWIALLAFGLADAMPTSGYPMLRIAAWVGLGCGPLALLAVLWLLLLRTGAIDANRYARTAAELRTESLRLGEVLSLLNSRIRAAREDLTEQAQALVQVGDETGVRLAQASGELGREIKMLSETASKLDDTTAAARTDLGVLLADLPQARERAAELGERLRLVGEDAIRHAELLGQRLTGLEGQAAAVDQGSATAARRLAIELERIEGSLAAVDRRMSDTTLRLEGASNAALEGAAGSLDAVRRAIEEQGAAVTALVAHGHDSFREVGDESSRLLMARLDALAQRFDAVGGRLRAHESSSRGLLGQLDQALGAVEQRFNALGDHGAEQTADLAEALATLSDHASEIGRTLGHGHQATDALLGRVELLQQQLDTSNSTLRQTLPASIDDLHRYADEGLQIIARTAPEAARMAQEAGKAADRWNEAGAVMDRHGQATIALTGQVQALQVLLARIDATFSSIAEGASTKLVDALLRVRETAGQAAVHAREALAEAVPAAAEALAETGVREMTERLRDVGQAEIGRVAAAAEQAAEAGRAASERLTRQLMMLAETTQSIEARLAEHRAAVDADNEGGFARQIGLLIEALNSTAIDVGKVLSAEPSDAAWAAYLKGDRGIFTRRAVRLLDGGDVRAITQRYGDDGDFHELVNRYVHDFEAMLRRVLSMREGGTLGVTLLSSDAGKLYVALAQAIERLRR